jgi:hypothetical protein
MKVEKAKEGERARAKNGRVGGGGWRLSIGVKP